MKKLLVIIALGTLMATACFALVSDRVTFVEDELKSSLERSFFEDLDKGSLSNYTLFDAFLIASDITKPSDFESYRAKLSDIRQKALQDIGQGGDAYQKAKALLLWLHDNVLKKYDAGATLASDILDSGTYNCLSASVLYAVIANDLALDVKGVIVNDHAFCMLADPRGDIDIETTIRYGFNPGTKEIQKLKKYTRYIYVPKKDYLHRRTVTALELIGAMYSNLVSVVENQEENNEPMIDYEKDLPKFKKGYYFDQDSKVFGTNIEVCLNNLAIRYIDSKDFEKAYSCISQGKKFDPDSEDFQTLEKKFYSARAVIEVKAGNYEKGISYMKTALVFYPADEKLNNNLAYCYAAWGNSYFEKHAFKNAAEIFEEGLKSVPKDDTLLQNARASYHNLALLEYKKENYRQAAGYADKGLELFPDDKDLSELKHAAEDALRQ